uniref:Zinc finger protein n=1 Tax=Ciona intestinalis TaxID=7719 RepID=Q1RPW6_CIOIN|nr:uncharacterized protein LOC723798 [Ciona intestinalis]BAE93319.1 zinc finger protein [Ciona intestinalis]|eukprot:NP_001037822.1 zinc finger protein LOC723798 [Ciona intestinalis]
MEERNNAVLIASHPNIQPGSMSVDATHKLAMLASRRYLTLIDLTEPNRVIERVNLRNKWDVSHVLWNPTTANQKYFLTTYNQWTDLWQYEENSCKKLATLQGHMRSISDADWSFTEPNILATCSLDGYIYVWDMRETKRCKLCTSSVVGASQVKWNRMNPYCFASSHDGNIRIWDSRNCKIAVQHITAHLSKIYSLDWSRSEEFMLSSSSQDSNIRFWNTREEPRSPEGTINVGKPVWKAKYTPFGNGILSTGIVNFRETPISLWSLEETSQPVITYTGHTDVVLHAHWRKCNEVQNDQNWQLVTWSKDQTLRLWPMTSADLLEKNYDESRLSSNPLVYNLPSTTLPNLDVEPTDPASSASGSSVQSKEEDLHDASGFTPPTMNMIKRTKTNSIDLTSSHNLEQEFKMLNSQLPNLRMKHLDIQGRKSLLSLRTTTHYTDIHIMFPDAYPNNEAPIFNIKQSNMEQHEILNVTSNLQETAQTYVKTGRNCLEPCMRQLIAQMSRMSYMSDCDAEELGINFPSPFSSRSRQYSLFNDLKNVPFPRTTGARFNQSGLLVVFMRPTYVKGYQSMNEKTPRSFMGLFHHRNSAPVLSVTGFPRHIPSSLSHMTPRLNPAPWPDLSVSSYYYKEKRPCRKSLKFLYNPSVGSSPKESSIPATNDMKHTRMQQVAGMVSIVNVTSILPISKTLAMKYVIPHNSYTEACRVNMKNASSESMQDLVQLWSYLSVLPSPTRLPPTSDKFNEFSKPSFAEHPTGAKLLLRVFKHYEKLFDVQTLAMLACTFVPDTEEHTTKQASPRKQLKPSSSYSSFDVFDTGGHLHKSASETKFSDLPSFIKSIARSPPTSETFLKSSIGRSREESPVDDYRFVEQPLLDIAPSVHEHWMVNSRLLLPEVQARCNDYISRYADLLHSWKMDSKRAETCKYIRKIQAVPPDTKTTTHNKIKKQKKTCVICKLPLTKTAVQCIKCGHGSHQHHLKTWFESRSTCPICDCDCFDNIY